ncbi:MAG: nucleotidyltransferase domain-containing protein, partial [Candidatus Bathyarchaeia archaeon]
ILYGSLAKGLEKPYPESDIDVLVVAGNIPKDLFERRMMALKIKEDCLLIEDIWITPEELIDAVRGGWGLILDALEDGVVIYDRNGTIAEAKNILKSNYKRLGRIWILKT